MAHIPDGTVTVAHLVHLLQDAEGVAPEGVMRQVEGGATDARADDRGRGICASGRGSAEQQSEQAMDGDMCM
jgi:hypothetical protein